MLNIYTLHYFYVTAQHLNFSKAAKHLYITQPALSKQIQQLEDQLQVKLFDRTKRSVKLTEAGMVLLDHCAKIFKTINDLELAMDQFRKEVRGDLRIAAIMSLGNYILPDLLKEFSNRFPQIMLHTILKPVEEVVHMIKMGELDFGLINTAQEYDGLECMQMNGQRLVFICGKNCDSSCGHEEKEMVSLKNLEACRFISFDKRSLTRKAIDALAKKNEIKLNTVVESQNIEIVKSMVIRGMGGSIVPECAIRHEIKDKLVTVKEIEGVALRCPVSLYYKKDLMLTKAHTEFLKIFESFCSIDDFDTDNQKGSKSKNSNAVA